MAENPLLRRGPSGPFAENSGGGDFEPFDNSYYFDPDYVDSDENGSIADPFGTWAQVVATANAGTSEESSQFYFPGYPIVPTAEVIESDNTLVFQGQKDSEVSSFINGFITLDENGGSNHSTTFRDMTLFGLHLTGGNYALVFERCTVGDIDTVPGNQGPILGYDCDFVPVFEGPGGRDTPDNRVKLQGGSVVEWRCFELVLTDLTVGQDSPRLTGTLTILGDSCICRGVTFLPESVIVFEGDEGELFLDPESYKSFLDNLITLTNGHVTRLDGSWPKDATTYNDGDPINWFLNPRAIYNSNNAGTLVFEQDPLTREVQLLVNYTAGGEGGSFSWPANCQFAGGVEPVQVTTVGSKSLFRLDWEESLGFYIVWAVAIDIQTL